MKRYTLLVIVLIIILVDCALAETEWNCSCGRIGNTGNYCPQCGESSTVWIQRIVIDPYLAILDSDNKIVQQYGLSMPTGLALENGESERFCFNIKNNDQVSHDIAVTLVIDEMTVGAWSHSTFLPNDSYVYKVNRDIFAPFMKPGAHTFTLLINGFTVREGCYTISDDWKTHFSFTAGIELVDRTTGNTLISYGSTMSLTEPQGNEYLAFAIHLVNENTVADSYTVNISALIDGQLLSWNPRSSSSGYGHSLNISESSMADFLSPGEHTISVLVDGWLIGEQALTITDDNLWICPLCAHKNRLNYCINDGIAKQTVMMQLMVQYKDAELQLMSGNYEEAIAAFDALGNYSDAEERANVTRYAYAETLIAAKDYSGALNVLSPILDDNVLLRLNEQHPEIIHYIETLEQVLGQSFFIGTYPFDADGLDRKPIEWIVLKLDGTKVLLISKYVLDIERFNSKPVNVTWEQCSLRPWMNNIFTILFSTTQNKPASY